MKHRILLTAALAWAPALTQAMDFVVPVTEAQPVQPAKPATVITSRVIADPDDQPPAAFTRTKTFSAPDMVAFVAKAAPGPRLGVSTSAVPSVAATQLGLKHGLVVDHVQPDSPAAEAKLQEQDILLQVNDQLLFNQEQLSQLLAYYGEGKEITLQLLRKGERTTATCKVRMLAQADVPDQVADTLRLALRGIESGGVMIGDTAKDLDAIQTKFGALQTKVIDLGSAFATIRTPDGIQLKVDTREGKRHLIIQDKDGKVQFEGPLGTDEDRDAIPEAYRATLKLLHGAGIDD